MSSGIKISERKKSIYFQVNMRCATWCRSCRPAILSTTTAPPTTPSPQSSQLSMKSSRSIQSSQGQILWNWKLLCVVRENSFRYYFCSTSFPRIFFNQSLLTKSSDSSVLLFQPFRSLLEAGGVDRLMTITRQRTRFSSRVVKFAGQVKIVSAHWFVVTFNRWQILYLFSQPRFSPENFELLT